MGPLASPAPGVEGDVDPAFSPDGRNLALCRIPRRTRTINDIYILALSNGKPDEPPRRLTRVTIALLGGLSGHQTDPKIVFASNRGGRRSLWRVAASMRVSAFLPATARGWNVSRDMPTALRWPPNGCRSCLTGGCPIVSGTAGP